MISFCSWFTSTALNKFYTLFLFWLLGMQKVSLSYDKHQARAYVKSKSTFYLVHCGRRKYNIACSCAKAQRKLWRNLAVCGVTAMTENQESISILSWLHKIYYKEVHVVKCWKLPVSQLSNLQEHCHCKHWVRIPDCLATLGYYCVVTGGSVSLNCCVKFDKKMR